MNPELAAAARQVSVSFALSQVAYTLSSLSILDIIDQNGPSCATKIALEIERLHPERKAVPQALFRFLRSSIGFKLLSIANLEEAEQCVGVVDGTDIVKFALTPLSSMFVSREFSFKPILEHLSCKSIYTYVSNSKKKDTTKRNNIQREIKIILQEERDCSHSLSLSLESLSRKKNNDKKKEKKEKNTK